MKTTDSLLRIAKQFKIWAIVFLFLGILLDTVCLIGIMMALRDMDAIPNAAIIGMIEIFVVTILIYLILNTISYYLKLKVEVALNIEKLVDKEKGNGYFTI